MCDEYITYMCDEYITYLWCIQNDLWSQKKMMQYLTKHYSLLKYLFELGIISLFYKCVQFFE